jgi:3-isopropylmalate/(R)-2-methylmalate dehydratase small subunit
MKGQGMEAFTRHTGIAAPLDRSNVDTDAIIPKQFLRKVERTGFGRHLFHEWRYTDYDGTQENPDFVLNQEPYRKATILLAQENFGCGSSREHAPWALLDFGIRVIIAPSFADIFYNNSLKNGIVLITLPAAQVSELFAMSAEQPLELTVDLPQQTVTTKDGQTYAFDIDGFAKDCLLKGLDPIDWTLQFEDRIVDYEETLRKTKPWLV